jgi:hypothetical protein
MVQAVGADESRPEIVTRVLINGKQFDNFNNLDIDKSVTIDIMSKGYYDISWLTSDYKISVCNVENGCTNNSQELIPLSGGYEQNSLSINDVKIVRTGKSRFTLYFLKTGNFEVNISAIYLRVENPYASQPKGWDNCSVSTCYSTSTTPLRLNVKSAVINSRDINNFSNQYSKLESKFTCPAITESQKDIECIYVASYAVDKKFWADYGITNDSEAVLSGKVNSNFCSTSYKEYSSSTYGKCREKPEFVGATPLEFFIKEVTLNEENKIRFKNQYKQQNFCLTGETFSDLACYVKQTKTKYSASQKYKSGKAMVLDTSQETLLRQGFFGIFGATGKPVKSKATNWCVGMQTMFPPYVEDKNLTRGCVDAAMTLYRK